MYNMSQCCTSCHKEHTPHIQRKKFSLAKEQPDGQSLHRRFASRDLTTLHLLSIFSLAHRASTCKARDERHSKNILRIIMDAK